MKRILLIPFLLAGMVPAMGQDFSADKLIDMLSLKITKFESLLLNKKYNFSETEYSGDTAIRVYESIPVISFNKKKHADTTSRRFIRYQLKETFTLSYQTTSAAEQSGIITALKKKGFYCEYEKDSAVSPLSYLYQHEDYTADAGTVKGEDTVWYSITFFKKNFPVEKELYFGEDLLQFTSHEYLVYYFGEKNVKKDIYYFGGGDIEKCSVLLINTKFQVIFIWRDGLNRRKIANLLFGGQHRLKSQEGNNRQVVKDTVSTENGWKFKNGIYVGMPLYDLRGMNQKNIAFCGGNAPNPGLVFPESTGRVNLKNKDVILGCVNCSDDEFLKARIMNADKAMQDGRIFFILTIVLYPVESGLFE